MGDKVKSLSLSRPIHVYEETVDLPSIAAGATIEQSVTCNGAEVGDIVLAVNKPSLESGLIFGSGRVSAADTILFQVVNASAGAVDEASEDVEIVLAKG